MKKYKYGTTKKHYGIHRGVLSETNQAVFNVFGFYDGKKQKFLGGFLGKQGAQSYINKLLGK